MMNLIKKFLDKLRRKPLFVKPVVNCNSCNDYGYIDVIFGQNGKYDCQMICPKCNGKSKST